MATIIIPGRVAQGPRPTGPLILNRDHYLLRHPAVRVYPLSGAGTSELLTGLPAQPTSVNIQALPHLRWGTPFFTASLSGSFVTVDTPTWLAGASTFSFALWANSSVTSSSGGGGGLRVLGGNEGGGPGQFVLRYDPTSGKFQFYVFNSAVGVFSTTTVVANTDYHVGVIYDNQTITIYINGQLEATQGSAGATLNVTPTPLTFFNDGGFDSFRRQWNGTLTHAVLSPLNIGPQGMWNLYAPQTRWGLYWQPGRRVYSDQAISAARLSRLTLAGVG